MKCSNCRNNIPNDSKICPICGTIFASYFEDIILTRKQKRVLFFHRMFFPFLILIVVIIFTVFLLIRYDTKLKIINESVVKDNNEFYDSTEKYYKYILNTKEKELYDIIISSINNYEESVVLDLSNYNIDVSKFRTESLRNIKHVLSMDHPELIMLSSINVSDVENNKVKLIINYTASREVLSNSLKDIKDIISEVKVNTENMNELDKVKYVYEYLGEVEGTRDKDTRYYSAYSCLMLRKCNEYGFAKTVQIIFTNIGVNSTLVVGTLNNKYHEWNIVEIEGKYYNFDLANKKMLFKDNNYVLYHKNVIPSINGKKYIIK